MKPFTFSIETLSGNQLLQLQENVMNPVPGGLVEREPFRRDAAIDAIDAEWERRYQNTQEKR